MMLLHASCSEVDGPGDCIVCSGSGLGLRQPRVLRVSGGRREVDEARCLVDGGERLAMNEGDEEVFQAPGGRGRGRRESEAETSATEFFFTNPPTRSAAAEMDGNHSQTLKVSPPTRKIAAYLSVLCPPSQPRIVSHK